MLDLYYSQYLNETRNKCKVGGLILLMVCVAAIESFVIPRSLSNMFEMYDMQHISKVAMVLVGFIVLYSIKVEMDRVVAYAMQDSSRQKFLRAIVMNFSENYKELDIGNYLNRITDATFMMVLFVRGVCNTLLPQLLSLIGIVIYVSMHDSRVGAILGCSILSGFFLCWTLGKKMTAAKRRSNIVFYKLFNTLDNKFTNLMNIYINSEEEAESSKISKDLTHYKKLNMVSAKYLNLLSVGLIVNFMTCFLVAIYILVRSHATPNKLLHILLLFFFIISISLSKETPPIINYYTIAEYSAEFLRDIVNHKSTTLHTKLQTGEIDITNLTFGYKTPLLKNAEIHIGNQEKVALVGRSGSGKSTLAKILVKLYTNYTGEVKIGNVNLKHINASYLRKKVLYINQRTSLVDGTVLYNMKYGNTNTNTTNTAVINLLKKYDLLKVFSNLHNGIDAKISTRGSNLSTGMQKVVFLIRGILKMKNALIVIFDEPLAGLDQATRASVLQMMKIECKNKTMLIITHDMEIKQIVDRVIDIKTL
jgi:ATP-binding cassette subfamily C protein